MEVAMFRSKPFTDKCLWALAAIVIGLSLGVFPGAGLAAEWEQTVAAAKKEGRVVVFGPPRAATRDILTLGFQKKYPDIRVDYTGARGGETSAKLLTERRAGQHLRDLVITGSSAMIAALIPAKSLVPVQPYLVGPDIQEKKWLGGKFDFADDAGQYVMAFSTYAQQSIGYNPKKFDASQIKSWKDLLNPKWKGKFATDDPRRPGPGEGLAQFLYFQPDLGKEFIKRLYVGQKAVISPNRRQIWDWIARGKYMIAIGPSLAVMTGLKKRGLPLAMIDQHQLKEGGYTTSASGNLGVVANAPHPNAAKVYLNYLLSRDGQYAWSKATSYGSRRTDVPTDHLPPAVILRPDGKYMQTYKEPFAKTRRTVRAYMKSLLGG